MPKKKVIRGLHEYRFKENPEEKRFAQAWLEQNIGGRNLCYLLDPHSGANGVIVTPPDREQVVAATVIQWLGSPVGQAFLSDLGYVKKDK